MHAGLEEALTKNGGEAASSFSRYVVEAIAADIAEKHPLGLGADAQSNTGEGGRMNTQEVSRLTSELRDLLILRA